MQFTKLRLAGFKSFVDAIELTIEPGITGVVGPNGCGKSNLLEALKWVMGETSAKQVRGNEMDDVIFSGTSNRPARNLAEVGLELDNTDRTAPAQFNDSEELEVVRRIEREKGSTYKVNAKEVRARDVHLLFADQASGARSTALVSQGHIGEVISAKPADRRKLLEEAAGITGLHTRRHEAELRLRGAESNLDRLNDILATLDVQMQNFRKQVKQATRYRNLNDHIRKAQAAYFLIRWKEALKEIENAKYLLKESERSVAVMTGHTTAAATEQAEAASFIPQRRKEETEASAAVQHLSMARNNLEEEEKRLEAELQKTETHLAQTSQDMDRERILISDCASAIDRLEREHQEISRINDHQNETIEQASQNLKAAKSEFEALDGKTSSAIKKLAADEARSEDLIRRHSEIEARVDRLRHEKEEVGSQIKILEQATTNRLTLQKATANLESTSADLQELRNLASTADAARLQAMSQLNIAQIDAQESLSEANRLEAEEIALSELLETNDPDLWPPLVDALNIEVGYEKLLGAALGDDLSASTDEAAPIYWTSLPDYDNAVSLPAGVIPLSDYVSGSSALVRRLSQIGVVEDRNIGSQLAGQLKQGQRLVALDGSFWRWDGYTATSDAPAAAAVRVEQRNRLKKIRQKLASAKSTASLAEDQLTTAKTSFDQAVLQESKARGSAQQLEQRLADAQKSHGELQQKSAETDTKLSAQRETLARIVNDFNDAKSLLVEATLEKNSHSDAEIDEKELEILRSQASDAHSVLIEAQGLHDTLQRQTEERYKRSQILADELSAWKERDINARSQMQHLEDRHRDLLEDKERVSAQPDEIFARRANLLDKAESAEAKRKKAADKLVEAETKLAAADKNLRNAEEQLAHIREDKVRTEATVDQAKQTMETLIERIVERLSCRPEDLHEISAIKNDSPLPELEVAEKKVERLERERENMGPVNLRAESEFQEISEQVETLVSEKEDLLKAIEKLRRGISELNREGRQRLLSSFTEVNKHFQELFARLFGGGKAYLTLTESEDPLEAGIEIMASPPGKRLQVLSLLSGGEQALTALALLFGVFLTNPAPICVLDEVDAPLDDANVDRFCTLVNEIAHSLSTRFIVVTHHRMTMARVDRLYGITMGEQGVSQLVSVDLGQAMELRDIA